MAGDIDTKLVTRLEREGDAERLRSYHEARAQADRLEAGKDRSDDRDLAAAMGKTRSVWGGAQPSPVPSADTYVCPTCGAAALTAGACPGTDDDPHHARERVLVQGAS